MVLSSNCIEQDDASQVNRDWLLPDESVHMAMPYTSRGKPQVALQSVTMFEKDGLQASASIPQLETELMKRLVQTANHSDQLDAIERVHMVPNTSFRSSVRLAPHTSSSGKRTGKKKGKRRQTSTLQSVQPSQQLRAVSDSYPNTFLRAGVGSAMNSFEVPIRVPAPVRAPQFMPWMT